MQAVAGGMVEIGLGARRLKVRVPPGLRTGEHLRLKAAGGEGGDLYLPVRIRPEDGVSAFGESRPLVQTADGVREPQNRRVEIVLP